MKNVRPTVCLVPGDLVTTSESKFSSILARLGVLERLRTARTVFMKVNLCAGTTMTPDTGVNVSVRLAMRVVDLLRAENPDATIRIGDSDSVGFGFAWEKFCCLGYDREAAARSGLELVDLSRTQHVVVSSGEGYLRRFLLPQVALASDFVVSLAKAKTHNMTTVTGALKNHFGTLPDFDKSRYHPFLDQVVPDVNAKVPTHLAIVDGNPGMDGNGPVRGTARDFGLTLVGNNPVATDATMARLMGFRPERIGHLCNAARRSLGPIRAEEIDVVGEAYLRDAFGFVSKRKRLIMKAALATQGWGQRLVRLGHEMHRVDGATDLQRLAARLTGRLRVALRR